MFDQSQINTANALIDEIKKISTRDLQDDITINKNGDIIPNLDYQRRWIEIIKKVNDIILYYNYYINVSGNENLYDFINYFKKLPVYLNSVYKKIIDPDYKEPPLDINIINNDSLENHFINLNSYLFDFEDLYSISFTYNKPLDNINFKELFNEVMKRNDSPYFDDRIINIYNSSDEDKKNILSRSLINIRNIFYKKNANFHDGYILKQNMDEIIELCKLNEANNLVSEVKEISKTIKTNATIETNIALLTSYEDITNNLKKEIENLNNYIVLSFLAIIIIFCLKSILIIFFGDTFKDLYNLFVFFTLILSCSALLTYFIKEKNHLRKLYDFYLMKVLELKALPDYMNELNPEQRRSLIIQLAPMYFLGDREIKTNNINLIDEKKPITGMIEDLTKVIKELKSLKD